jgi:hypothetical protein
MDDNRRQYLIYVTANDDDTYLNDFLNFDDMARFPSGVSHLDVVIAVSQVKPFSEVDKMVFRMLRWRIERTKHLNVSNIIFKGNVGRDFSSVKVCLDSLKNIAKDDSFILVRNRSSYGPVCRNWFSAFSEQYSKHPDMGLVGSTISLSGHPTTPNPEGAIHIQSYCYFSQWCRFKNLIDDFPGSRSLDRISTIVDGEIELSRRIMANGLKIACLNWPDTYFDFSMLNTRPSLYGRLNENVKELPLRYKIYRKSLRRLRGLFLGVFWIILMKVLTLSFALFHWEISHGSYQRLYEYD